MMRPRIIRAAAAVVGAAAALALAIYLRPSRRTAVAHIPAGVTVPAGMIYIPGGDTRVGDDTVPDEAPAFDAHVEPFLLDRHPVTVADFGAFVAATGYTTEAERLASAGVLDPAIHTWRLVEGATWRRPLGPDHPPAAADHPVTQVSWNDAVAFAAWAGKRLPTEIEWEHAARGARNARAPYAWGEALVEGGRHRANTWQGAFPTHNAGDDGFLYTSPVGTFGATALGLTDMGGNVWEWTQDWYRPYADRSRTFTPDPTSEKVQRGGSFLCQPDICHGYRVSARSYSTPDTSLFNVGFRCARNL